MPPLRDAVCFVDGKERKMHIPQQIVDFGDQFFGRYIEEFQFAFDAGMPQIGIFGFVIATVQCSCGYSVGPERFYLVFHQ